MRCRTGAAAVESRPKVPLETRSRICAVSISKGFVHACRDSKTCPCSSDVASRARGALTRFPQSVASVIYRLFAHRRRRAIAD
jgi:hypothetical protein